MDAAAGLAVGQGAGGVFQRGAEGAKQGAKAAQPQQQAGSCSMPDLRSGSDLSTASAPYTAAHSSALNSALNTPSVQGFQDSAYSPTPSMVGFAAAATSPSSAAGFSAGRGTPGGAAAPRAQMTSSASADAAGLRAGSRDLQNIRSEIERLRAETAVRRESRAAALARDQDYYCY